MTASKGRSNAISAGSPSRKTTFRSDRAAARALAASRAAGNSVDADDFARVADHVRGEERDVAGAAPDVEHTHAGDDPGFTEEPLRDRVDEARLRLQTIELPIGMAEHVGLGRTSAAIGIVGHDGHPPVIIAETYSAGRRATGR